MPHTVLESRKPHSTTTRRHILHTWVPTLDSARREALKPDTLSTLHTFISPLEAIPGPGLTYISMPYSHNKRKPKKCRFVRVQVEKPSHVKIQTPCLPVRQILVPRDGLV